MDNPITRRSWSLYVVGAAIGVLSWFAFATADKPVGITTAFENTAALVEKAAIPDFEQANGYFAAKAKEGKSPKVDWEWMLVLGVFLGALLSASLSGDRPPDRADRAGPLHAGLGGGGGRRPARPGGPLERTARRGLLPARWRIGVGGGEAQPAAASQSRQVGGW